MALTVSLINLEQTKTLGCFIGSTAQPGEVFLLAGDLGAGKTTLTQFIGAGLQVPPSCYITSPTFSGLHEYPGRLPLYHFDLYRLADEEEIMELGFTDILHGHGISVVEWPDRLGIFTPGDHFTINLSIISPQQRLATITSAGQATTPLNRFADLPLL